MYFVGVFRDIDGGVVSSLPLFMPIPADVEQDYFIQLPTYYYIDLHFTRWIGEYYAIITHFYSFRLVQSTVLIVRTTWQYTSLKYVACRHANMESNK